MFGKHGISVILTIFKIFMQIWTAGPMKGRCANILQPTSLNFGYVVDKTNTKTT